MEYEVKHNGEAVGTLQVGNEGLMTVFEARTCRLEGIQRLWVWGGEKSAYLGVLMPAGNEMCLRKKLSRRDMMEFPDVILYAATAEKPADIAEAPAIGLTEAPPAVITAEPTQPPAKVPDEESGPIWHSAAMGTLTAVMDGMIYTAIPVMLRRMVRGVRIEIIDGRSYIIFRRSY